MHQSSAVITDVCPPLIKQRVSSVCDTHIQFIQRFTRVIVLLSMARTNALSEMLIKCLFRAHGTFVEHYLNVTLCFRMFREHSKVTFPLITYQNITNTAKKGFSYLDIYTRKQFWNQEEFTLQVKLRLDLILDLYVLFSEENKRLNYV